MMNGAQLKSNPDSSDDEGLKAMLPIKELMCDLNRLRKSGEFCDVSIALDDRKYPAHKILLASFSPYFKGLFAGGFSEANEPLVKLTDIDAATTELVLEYVYEGLCVITHDNVQNVLHAANFLQTTPLFDQCITFLEGNLNAENCLGILSLARIYFAHGLEEKAMEYLLKNFSEVCKEEEFLELNSENLIDLIASDSLNVPKEASEVEVFNAVIRWLNYKEEDRAAALPKVLAQVRLAHVPADFLYCRVESVRAIQNSRSCMRLIKQAAWYRLVPSAKLELQSSVSRRRRQWSQFEVMLIFGECPGVQGKSKILVREDGRLATTRTPVAVEFEYCCTYNDQSCCLAVNWESIYNVETGSNPCYPSFPKARHWFGIAELDMCCYVIGGMADESNVRDNVDKYHSTKKTWTACAPLLFPVYYPAVVTLRGKIYVLGGLDDNRRSTSTVQRYDPVSDSWTQLPHVPVKRGQFKACGIYDQIYVCQFFAKVAPVDPDDDSRHVYVYNVATNKWRSCGMLCHPFVSGPVPFNGNMFALTERADKERVLEKYTPSSDTWKEFANFHGYTPNLIAGPLLISRPTTQCVYVPKGPSDFVRLIK